MQPVAIETQGNGGRLLRLAVAPDVRVLQSRAIGGEPARGGHARWQRSAKTAHQIAAVHPQAFGKDKNMPQATWIELADQLFASG